MSRYRLVFVWALVLAGAPIPASAQQLRFSGFGDFTFGAVGGGVADSAAKAKFELFGSDPEPLNTTRGFGLTGTDFVVIADMTDKFTFLGELNLQTERGGSSDISLDVERFFVHYRIDPKFNVQAGLFFTPIGYNNRFLYARAWLMNSIQVPDFFEEELNLFPTHSIGVSVHGEFALKREGHRIGYIGSVSNGRATTPDSAVYARDGSRNKEVTGLVEWLVPGYKDSRFGFSAWNGRIASMRVDDFGLLVDPAEAAPIRLSETGIDAFAVVNTRRVSLNAEYVRSRQTDTLGTLSGARYTTQGGMAELSAHFIGGRLHPYVRYDRTSVPDGGGAYLSLREVDDQYTRVYVPDFEAVMTGVAFDVNLHSRLKVEYSRHLGGPRQRNAVAFQTAFGF